MGCKYWETAAAEGLIDYDQMVQYPFGHGLSYTTFLQALFNDDPGDVLEKLLTRLKQNKGTKNIISRRQFRHWRQNRLSESRAIVAELEEMGLEDNEELKELCRCLKEQ